MERLFLFMKISLEKYVLCLKKIFDEKYEKSKNKRNAFKC